jgi:uncharacterized protein YozE (UPF0346 family)
MLKKIFIICFTLLSFHSFTQNIEGLWRGTFVMYLHNTYEVEMDLKKLPSNIFTAKLRITNGFYKGEYSISGNICNNSNLEITAIFLLKENGGSNWVDCLNGTLDLNENETILSFVDTWKEKSNNNYANCKVKFIQSDMFQCLRSAYLYKANYEQMANVFDNLWDKYDKLKKEQPTKIVETYIVEKNEEKMPIIETANPLKDREVNVKNEVFVSSKNITIEYWDKYTFDYDSISLYLNDKPILENVLLTKTKQVISIEIEKGNNYLILHALNLGLEPPNTASITIKDGKKIQNVMLYSDLSKSGALKIVLKE